MGTLSSVIFLRHHYGTFLEIKCITPNCAFDSSNYGIMRINSVRLNHFFDFYKKLMHTERRSSIPDVTEKYVVKEVVYKTLGDYSTCRYLSYWETVVLSGDIQEVKFSLARIVGDVESRLSVIYRISKKGGLIRNFLNQIFCFS